jgi:hypothetical protein
MKVVSKRSLQSDELRFLKAKNLKRIRVIDLRREIDCRE